MIYAITGREVPVGKLPMDVHCVVQNVASAVAIADAVVKGRPSIDRITTVTGKPVVNPGNWRFRLGTPISKALELVGGVSEQPAKLLLGGPMMGIAQSSLGVTVMKNTSGILLIAADEVSLYTSEPCIRCGRCLEACAMFLNPSRLALLVRSEDVDALKRYHMTDCFECAACSYACPSSIPLVQLMRVGKAMVRQAKS